MEANWYGHGRAGGPRRKTRMLHYLELLAAEIEHDGMVLALPGGTGTANLCEQARRTASRWPAIRRCPCRPRRRHEAIPHALRALWHLPARLGRLPAALGGV